MMEYMPMRNEFIVETLETLFPLAIAAAIGVCAANLAVQITKERAAPDAVVATHEQIAVSFPRK
jgi:hypothetical protein